MRVAAPSGVRLTELLLLTLAALKERRPFLLVRALGAASLARITELSAAGGSVQASEARLDRRRKPSTAGRRLPSGFNAASALALLVWKPRQVRLDVEPVVPVGVPAPRPVVLDLGASTSRRRVPIGGPLGAPVRDGNRRR